MLDIIPGVFHVPSAYQIDEVNLYSKKVIRYAMGLCFMNILLAIVRALLWNVSAVIDSAISVLFNVAVLWMAVRCVRSKNAKCCCGLSTLTFYRYFVMFNMVINTISIPISISWIITGGFWYIVNFVYFVTLFSFNFLQFRYSNKVLRALSVQVQPHNPAARAVPAVATPAAAVTTYAAVEMGTPSTSNPNGYA